MNGTRAAQRVKVTGDGKGVASHAGSSLIAEPADQVGLTAGLAVAMATRRRRSAHDPGVVLTQLAVMLVDSGDCLADIAVLRQQPQLSGRVGSDPTVWRVLDSVALARPGQHRGGSVGGEGSGVGRRCRTRRGRDCIDGCIERGVGFLVGLPIDAAVRDAFLLVQEEDWVPAIESDGAVRDGASLVELTDLVNHRWGDDVRVIARRERPHPGAASALPRTPGYATCPVKTSSATRRGCSWC